MSKTFGLSVVVVALALGLLGWFGILDDMFSGGPNLYVRGVVTEPGLGGLEVVESLVPGLYPADTILAIRTSEGRLHPLRRERDLARALAEVHGGDALRLTVTRGNGGADTLFHVTLPAFEAASWWQRNPVLRLTFNLWIPLISLLAAAMIGLVRPDNPHALRAALLFAFFPALFAGTPAIAAYPLAIAAHLYSGLGAGLAGFFFCSFFLRYPNDPVPGSRRVAFERFAFAVALLLVLERSAFGLTGLASYSACGQLARLPGLPYPDWAIVLGNAILFAGGAYFLVLKRREIDDPAARTRLQLLALGASSLLALFLIASAQIAGITLPLPLVFLLLLATSLFPLSFIYVVVRHRIFGIQLILRRGLQYALISRGFLALLALIVFMALFFGGLPVMKRLVPAAGPETAALVTATLTLVVAYGLRSLHARVMPIIDRSFFREAYDAEKLLLGLHQSIRELAAEPHRLLTHVLERIASTVHPAHLAIYLRPELMASILKEGPSSTRDDELVLAAHMIQQGTLVLPESIEDCLPERQAKRGTFPPAKLSSEPCRTRLFPSGEGLLIPLSAYGDPAGVLVLGERLSGEPYSSRDRELLATTAQQLASALDNARMIGEIAERERVQQQLEIAKDVQARLFPQRFPDVPRLDYTGICLPAQGVGGDYYDFLRLSPHHLGLALGDISGKGISAALLMASLQATLRSQAPHFMGAVGELVTEINRLLEDTTSGRRFATFFYALYDARSGFLTYVNAGHNPPLVLRPRDGQKPTIHRLERQGMAIGLFADRNYGAAHFGLSPGDLLVIYSDGITEAMSDGEPFDEARLIELLGTLHDEPVETIRDAVLSTVAAFSGGTLQQDDQTLIVARYGTPQKDA